MAHLETVDLPKPAAEPGLGSGTTAGKRSWWIWILLVGAALVGIWYYRSSHAKAAADGANGSPNSAGGGPSAGNGRGGPGGGPPVVPVVVATAQRGDLPVYFAGLGTVTAFNTVTVHSRVDGQLVNVFFKEGQFVRQGDLLAQIDPRAYQVTLEQAEGALAKDQAQRKDAETNLERYKLLFNEGVIPKQQLDTQQAQVGQFEGSIQTDQATISSAKLQLSYSRITAPISGRVGLRLVDAGNMVHANDPGGLVVITQLQPISVIFSLPQDQLPQVVSKMRAGSKLPVDAFDRDNTAKIATGTLASIDNQIDVTTGTYKLKAMFSNDTNALFPNQFVNVHLLVDTKHDLTLVPTAAIQRGPQGTYVYAVDSNNTAKIHNVTVAQSTNDTVGVSDGLSAGELVVIDGQDKLQDGTRVSPASGNGSGRRVGGANPSDSGTPPQNANQQGTSPARGATRPAAPGTTPNTTPGTRR